MGITLKQIETRLAAVERQLAELQKKTRVPSAAANGKRKKKGRRDGKHRASENAIDAAYEEMGISGTPVGAERLQQMMIEAGIRPDDNSFSRGIIEMREE